MQVVQDQAQEKNAKEMAQKLSTPLLSGCQDDKANYGLNVEMSSDVMKDLDDILQN